MTTKQRSSRGALPAVTADLVRLALSFIPPDVGHDERVRMAFAVFDGLGDVGSELWQEWAAGRAQPSEGEDRAVWRSARKPGKTKVASLFGLAKDHGFRFPEGNAPQTPAVDEIERQAEAKRQRDAAEAAALEQRREDAASRCEALWKGARAAPGRNGCPYLKRKGVKGHGLRYLPGGVALVPMRDAGGRLWSVQRLLASPLPGRKAGESGTDKLYGPPKESPDELVSSRKLGLWHWIGDPVGAPALLLAEGYATAASLHEATGRPVAVCFDAGNLVHVGRELRRLYPTALLLVCGDDDKATEARRGKNPGRIAAAAAVAAMLVDGALAGAVFPAKLPEDAKDFNDLASSAGLDAIRDQVEHAIAHPQAPEVPLPWQRQGPKSAAGGPIDSEDDAASQSKPSGTPVSLLMAF